MFGERDFISQNIRKGRVSIFAFERRCAEQHFVDKDAQCPPVNSASMTITFNNFRSNVFLCPDERVGTEIRYARLCVNSGQRVGIGSIASDDHCWSSSGIRLF